jgi:hypothetical protein
MSDDTTEAKVEPAKTDPMKTINHQASPSTAANAPMAARADTEKKVEGTTI